VRAEALASTSAAAAEPLRFAAGLFRAQARVAAAIETAHARQPLRGALKEDLGAFADSVAGIFRFASEHGPAALAEHARARAAENPAEVRARLLAWWNGEGDAHHDYLSRAVLRPYAEVLARIGTAPDRVRVSGQCPFCGAAPWIAVRRSASLAEGARRLLGCSLCGREWLLGRIRCPACAQGDPEKLPSFSSAAYPAVRIEACEMCRCYVKSIDLTVDARALPEVDDLLSLSMDLWAAREGFTRLEPGLAGM
jgi:FdhE protein